MCDVDYGEYCDLWRQSTHRAREEHRCSECGLLVAPGELYQRTFWVHDGEAGVYATHPECAALLEYVAFTVCRQDTVYYGAESLRSRVREHLDDAKTRSLYRRHVRARMREGTWRPRYPTQSLEAL